MEPVKRWTMLDQPAEMVRWADGEYVLYADYDSDLSRLRGEVARLEQEKADFYMAYRCECDIETKALHGEVARLTAERDAAIAERDDFLRGRITKDYLLHRAETAEARVQALQQALEDVLGHWYYPRIINQTDDEQRTGSRPRPRAGTPTIAEVRRWRAVLAGEAAPTQEG